MSTAHSQKKPSPVLRGGRPSFGRSLGTTQTSSNPTAASTTRTATKTNTNPLSTIASNLLMNWRRSPVGSVSEQPKGSTLDTTASSREPPPHLPPAAERSLRNPSSPPLTSSDGETPSIQSSTTSSSTSTTRTPFLMEEGPSTSALISRLGIEKGYTLSPMYNLILEYNEEKGGKLSTAMEVSWVLMQPNLNPSDITRKYEEGIDPFTSICVKEEQLARILQAVNELQTFLYRMADLIEERTQVFCIDPQDTMTMALRGCKSRSQLNMAYKILGKHLQVAQQTVMKYKAKYQGGEVPLSPISTAPELYSDFERIDNIDGHMRYMLGNIPHHQGHLTSGALQAVRDRLSWDVVHLTQTLTWEELTALRTSPISQATLYPEQESNSDTFPAQPTPAIGKKHVDWATLESPWTDRLGKQFFTENSSSTNSALYFSTPGLNPGTDVTIRLATPSWTNLGDNIAPPTIQTVSQTTKENSHSGGGGQPPDDGNSSSRGNGGGYPHRGSGNGGGEGGGHPSQGGGGGGGNGPPPLTNFPHHDYGPPLPGSGGGGNPGGGDPPGGNPGWPSAPYGNMPASIKTELKVEQLPEWDGNHWTAIEYFWNVQQLAYLGGWLPEALGYWLWFHLKERSTFLKGIKDGFLGSRWQLKMNNYYNSQTFRERGHERESPTEFLVRQIVYTRMLLSVDPGGPLQVFYIMRKALISWGPILLLSSIKDSSELYSRVKEHEEALLEAYRVSKGGSTLSLDNIITHLKQLGLLNDRQLLLRWANFTQNLQDVSSPSDDVVNRPTDINPQTSSDQHVLHEVYQVLQKQQ
ncbi:hypothetical protein K443DRAFT_5803 [Laccaria amethystina LaAM-08-1]|uniref:Uncharacterized protein n=1 Tax=Laccaria amethystina LaAM-08-1 TaxID=1095629 RepID=A0A0C9Y486_9AGAR|nr:hypothetical protein K443DRAFT_5803 [Laccaria amethystina LaAM-08-1]